MIVKEISLIGQSVLPFSLRNVKQDPNEKNIG